MSDYATGESRVTIPMGGSSALETGMLYTFIAIAGSGTAPADRVPHDMPASIPEDQAYFWSNRWQRSERAAEADLAAGRYRDFADAGEAIRHLLDGDR
jgi:hypothetical protein